MKIKFFVFLFLVLLIPLQATKIFAQESKNLPELFVFYSLSCHKCIQAKITILPQIEQKLADKIRVKYYDIAEIENYKLLLSLKEAAGEKDNFVVPIFYIQGHF